MPRLIQFLLEQMRAKAWGTLEIKLVDGRIEIVRWDRTIKAAADGRSAVDQLPLSPEGERALLAQRRTAPTT